MASIAALHSFRGGTGKSNIAANVALLAARRGHSVGVLDTDVQSPGVHVILGLEKGRIVHTLTDFLNEKCEILESAYELTEQFDLDKQGGRLFLIPSSMKAEDIARIVSEGYDAERLNGQFEVLTQQLGLDVLLVDTHPGLSRETMLTAAICNSLAIVMRPDKQDIQGTAVLVELAKRLCVPRTFVIVNKVFPGTDAVELRENLQRAYDCEIVGVLPFREQLARLGSESVFAESSPHDPFVQELETLLEAILPGVAPGRASADSTDESYTVNRSLASHSRPS